MDADTQTFQETTMNITIYHNPLCSKSRQTLELLREAGHEPLVVEYLKTPPTPRQLQALVRRLGVQVRDLIRTNEPPYQELGLEDRKSTRLNSSHVKISYAVFCLKKITGGIAS